MVVIDQNNYLKDKPPKAAVVKIRIELLQVLEIGEIKMLFSTQYKLHMQWFDQRVTFYNLNDNQELNSLVQDEKHKIWTPALIFDNTVEKIRSLTDAESLISVQKKGNFSRNTIDEVDNVYMYQGGHNPLDMNRVYHTKW